MNIECRVRAWAGKDVTATGKNERRARRHIIDVWSCVAHQSSFKFLHTTHRLLRCAVLRPHPTAVPCHAMCGEGNVPKIDILVPQGDIEISRMSALPSP